MFPSTGVDERCRPLLPSRTVQINPESLRALRLAMGWSSSRFATAVGIKHPHLSNIEAGRRQASPELIDRMSTVLGVPKAALVSTFTPEEVA